METHKSLEIIESMLMESRKSLHRNSFYFILWGTLLIPAAIAEFFMQGRPDFWIIWPIVGVTGGIISAVYGKKEGQTSGTKTTSDRINAYTWGAFGFTLIWAIVYAVYNHLSPQPLILMLAGSATFISGGISKFKPFIWGGIILEIGALLCAFVIDAHYYSLVFAACIFAGYVIPGVILRREEHGQA